MRLTFPPTSTAIDSMARPASSRSSPSTASGRPPASSSTPFLRSCGCAHRFMPDDGVRTRVRDRRRSRSRTPTSSLPRSRTPSSVSSGRTTTTPSPQFRMTSRTMSEEVLSTSSEISKSSYNHHSCSRFQTMCWLEPRPVPIHYSSTVLMRMGSTRRRYVEEVTFQTRLVPRRFAESVVKPTAVLPRRYTAVLEIQCVPPAVHVISLNQPGINGVSHDV